MSGIWTPPEALLGTDDQPVEGLTGWAEGFRSTGVAREGNTPFSVPLISHIEGNLWTGGCIDDVRLPDHFKFVVSLYPWERYRIDHNEVSRLEVPLYDSSEGEPDAALLSGIASWVNVCRQRGPTLVHCQAGLNRSSLVAALALVLDGVEPAAAISLIRERRSSSCLCNTKFESWLRAFSVGVVRGHAEEPE